MGVKSKLELIWIGKEDRLKLEPRILLEDPEKSYHAPHRLTDHDIFDNRLIFGDNLDQLQQLRDEMGPNRTLLVMCMAFRGRPDRYPNLTIKKIPKAVLSRCEWGKDDYSLQVENLPKASPPKGQMELIPGDGDQMKQSQAPRGSDAREEAT